MMRNIDADYYGYMDDDDGLLVPSEERCEREAIREKVEEWKINQSNNVTMDKELMLPEMDVRIDDVGLCVLM
jgi:pre-mRNA-splicing factor ISY1